MNTDTLLRYLQRYNEHMDSPQGILLIAPNGVTHWHAHLGASPQAFRTIIEFAEHVVESQIETLQAELDILAAQAHVETV